MGDIMISVADTLMVYWCTHHFMGLHITISKILLVTFVAAISTGVGGYLFRTSLNTFRYAQFRSLLQLFYLSCVKSTLIAIAVTLGLFATRLSVEDRLIALIGDWLLTFATLSLFRLLIIIVYERWIRRVNSNAMRVLIYDNDEQSVSLRVRFSKSSRYKVLGFYVYGDIYKHRRLSELPVYYFRDEADFRTIINRYRIKAILFTNPDAISRERDRLLQYCRENDVRTLLGQVRMDEGGQSVRTHVRPVRVEDLLGRDEININMEEVAGQFMDKVVMVTGAAGSIGSELCRQLACLGVRQLIMFDFAETPLHNVRLEFEKKYPHLDFVSVIGDVRIRERLSVVFAKYRPHIVFHAAAYKHVPLMEEYPCEAIFTNMIGTKQVADLSVKFGVEKMIMISSDKAVNPTNVMGCTKRLAEMYVQSLSYAIQQGEVVGHTRFITTRFGNVLGSNGSVIPRFREQIEEGGPVTVTHPDIIRFFMTIPEASRLVMEAATMGRGDEIFVFEMGQAVKIVDLATRMIELAGYRPGEDIEIKFTGLRPGEKLYEEVLSNEENTLPTSNKKIKIAKVNRPYQFLEMVEIYKQFEKLLHGNHTMSIVRLMKEVVPEFISNNSRFSVLDKELKRMESVIKE
ncbi:MAG: polysaccharide biosynthesis protein [Mediterranea sp.]|jgi:FlaA1/EpsC-like NDP-sugar epimerase|nr:polysaccharide biosynthesis protein [Mediterranea sp.]